MKFINSGKGYTPDVRDAYITAYECSVFLGDKNPSKYLFRCIEKVGLDGELSCKIGDYFQSKDFTAVVCASDIMAMGLMDRLRVWGKKVPEDVSVVGFDDLEFMRYTNYDLTTVRQDFNLIGEKAFRILESMINGLSSQRASLGCTLIQRGSVKKID